jgi:hypothetical protein
VAGHTVIEKDANSTMVTNWIVAPAGSGSSVTVKTSWQGAGLLAGLASLGSPSPTRVLHLTGESPTTERAGGRSHRPEVPPGT